MHLSNRKTLLTKQAIFTSCIVPLQNEQENIVPFFSTLYEHLLNITKHFEIIAIDDGSTDKTRERLLSFAKDMPELKLIFLSRNFGKEHALSAGVDHVSGDVTLIMDGDFQHPFNVIPDFLDEWAKGYDMVYGVRRHRKDEGFIKKWFTGLFYRISQFLTEVPIPKDAGDFRLLDKKVIHALQQCPEQNRFMKGLYAWVGFDSVGVEFDVQERRHGKSSWQFRHLVKLALHGIFSFSNIPLRVWSILGLIISGISFIYALWIVFDVLLFGVDLPGFATIVVAIMFFGGIQLLSIGILGEYIGRIFTEVKQRPRYLISQTLGFEKKD